MIRGAGGPERLRPSVDDPDIGAVVMGLQSQGQAGRADPGHQDVGQTRYETSARRHHAASAAASARICGRASNSSRRSPGSTT